MDFQEPPVDPLDDTHPTQTVSQVTPDDEWTPRRPSAVSRLIGLVSLLAALGFTAATILLLLSPPDNDPVIVPVEPQVVTGMPDVQPPTTAAENTLPPGESGSGQMIAALPTIAPEMMVSLLEAPPQQVSDPGDISIRRSAYKPFTIIPDRPRNEVVIYEAVQGDTINGIAERFGLQPETIAWSNDRRIVQVLRPGDDVNVPPADGVLTTAIGSTRTLADYAALYKVNDPYIIIDSEYNPQLRGMTPDTIPPSGTPIFIPGGVAEEIVWTAEISVSEGGGGTGRAGASYVTFQPGDPGDCGPQEIVGGSVWTNPVPSGGYSITRGYASWHPGIDLAASVGVPIAAANGGRVIFAGWNNYGYGYMVALIHGPNMTVYGHLSDYIVGCGQDVAAGQIIGYMGSSGNSSGPHLHFEIRSRSGSTYAPLDPSAYIGF